MAQFVRPDADLVTGLWGATPLWSKVDEGAPGDDVTILSEAVGNNTDTTNADLQGSDVTDPSVSTGHIIRVEWNSTDAVRTIAGTVELWQGVPGLGTLIATLNVTPDVGATPTIATHTLTGAETDAITDYTALNFRLRGRGTSGGPARSLEVDFVELEVPDVAGGIAEADLNASGTSAVSFVGSSTAQADAALTGAGDAAFDGAAIARSDLAAAGASITAFDGAAVIQADLLTAGTSTANWEIEDGGVGGSDLVSAGTSTAAFEAEAVTSTALTATGASTFDAQGATVVQAELSAAGFSITDLSGAAVVGADLVAASASKVSWVSDVVIAESEIIEVRAGGPDDLTAGAGGSPDVTVRAGGPDTLFG